MTEVGTRAVIYLHQPAFVQHPSPWRAVELAWLTKFCELPIVRSTVVAQHVLDKRKQLALGVPTRMLAMAAIFLVVELGLISTMGTGLYVLGGVRAYASGESAWSKAQKDAVLHLRTYADTSEESEYAAYRQDIAVTIGDRDARTELERQDPDLERARQGFLQGRNEAFDVDSMIWLFRTFRRVPRVDYAVRAWSSADLVIDRLEDVAFGLRAGQSRASLVSELDDVNTQATELEDIFATSMGDTARLVQALVLAGAVISISLVLGFAGLALLLLGKRWKAADVAVNEELESQASIVAEQAALLDLAHDGILVWDLHSGAIRFWNHGAEVVYGWSREEALGLTPEAVLHTEFPRPLSEINADLVRTRKWEGELVHTCRDGRRIVVASRWALQVDANGQPAAVVAINRDISERKKAEHALAHQARHDALTGLPNRAFMQESLSNAIETLRGTSTPFALLLLDLDRFKDVNDSLGHGVGDAVLQRVGQRLLDSVRPTDVIARFGGDEFAVLLPGARRSVALEVANRLHHTLSLPIELEGVQLDLGVSIGITVAPEHGQDAEVLMRRADTAMYVAKRGGTGIAVHDVEMDVDNAERLRLTADLRHAIDNDELVLHYQPKIEAGGRLVGVEALVRWQHPARGLLGPDVFIPLAEQAGIIESLTGWILRSARQQQASWRADGLDLTMAVNLSMRNVHDPQLVETVRELLQVHAAGGFEVELTETTLMADADRAQSQLNRLRALGVRVAVDDFGTGYSSLAYLKRLSVDELKIDRCFVRDLARDERDRALVQATVGMAHSLGLRVVAEGVEDAETLEILRGIGCDMVQGYHISRPLPAHKLGEWARNWLPSARGTKRSARAA
jgi:diguanylate cyclase (GGDEF)-like protein/PAS domain S-box-containing protein